MDALIRESVEESALVSRGRGAVGLVLPVDEVFRDLFWERSVYDDFSDDPLGCLS